MTRLFFFLFLLLRTQYEPPLRRETKPFPSHTKRDRKKRCVGPRWARASGSGRGECSCRMIMGNMCAAPRVPLLRPLRSFAGVPGAPRSPSWPAASRPLSLWGGRCRRPRATGKVTRCVILQLSRAARNADACERSGHVITHRPPLPDLTPCWRAPGLSGAQWVWDQAARARQRPWAPAALGRLRVRTLCVPRNANARGSQGRPRVV